MNTPVVEDDEVKVKVLAAPINPSDINSIQGMIRPYLFEELLRPERPTFYTSTKKYMRYL